MKFEETVYNQQEPYIQKMPVKKKQLSGADKVIAVVIVLGLLITLTCIGVRFYRMRKVNAAVTLNNAQELEQFIKHNDKEMYAFYYGILAAANPISTSDLQGKYMAIRVDTEQYVTSYYYDTDGKRRRRSEWKRISSSMEKSDDLMMDGVPVSYYWMKDLPFRLAYTKDVSSEKRYRYYVVDEKIIGTAFIEMTDQHLVKGMKMYVGDEIEPAKTAATSWVPTILTITITIIISVMIKLGDLMHQNM